MVVAPAVLLLAFDAVVAGAEDVVDVPPDDVHAARNASAATTAVSAARRGREPGTAPNANRGGPPATRHGHRSCVVPAPAAGQTGTGARRELGRL